MIDTDASEAQVGYVHLQEQNDGAMKLVSYCSRLLCNAKRRCNTKQKECLAVVRSVLMLRPYLEGSNFRIRTDYQAVRWIWELAESAGCLARWRLRLLEFKFEVTHRPSMYHLAADAMSRLHKENSIEDDQVDDDTPNLDVQRYNENNLAVVCTVPHVKLPIPSEAMFLESQTGDTYFQNIMKIVGSE